MLMVLNAGGCKLVAIDKARVRTPRRLGILDNHARTAVARIIVQEHIVSCFDCLALRSPATTNAPFRASPSALTTMRPAFRCRL